MHISPFLSKPLALTETEYPVYRERERARFLPPFLRLHPFVISSVVSAAMTRLLKENTADVKLKRHELAVSSLKPLSTNIPLLSPNFEYLVNVGGNTESLTQVTSLKTDFKPNVPPCKCTACLALFPPFLLPRRCHFTVMDNVLCQKPVLESSPRSRRRRRRLMGHPARAPRMEGRKEGRGLLPGID